MKDDSVIRGRRAQGQRHLGAAMQSDAAGRDGVLQSPLLERVVAHGLLGIDTGHRAMDTEVESKLCISGDSPPHAATWQ